MKFSIYVLSLLLFSQALYSAVPVCSEHQGEIKHIRGVAYNSFLEAHKLTGTIIKSYVVTAEDIAWDAVQYKSTKQAST